MGISPRILTFFLFYQLRFSREIRPLFVISQQRCGFVWKWIDSNMNEVIIKSHEISGFQISRQADSFFFTGRNLDLGAVGRRFFEALHRPDGSRFGQLN